MTAAVEDLRKQGYTDELTLTENGLFDRAEQLDPAKFTIDSFHRFEKSVDEVLARLLAVGDDVDAGVFLLLEDEECGVALALCEVLAGEAPRCPQLVGFGEPRGFWQASGNGGCKHRDFLEYAYGRQS